jgi:hypothetical protein
MTPDPPRPRHMLPCERRELLLNIAMSSDPGTPGRLNEDFIGAVSRAAVLLDGAGITGAEAICHHGVAWYAHRLGGALLGRLSGTDGPDLVTILGDAIDQIAGEHRRTCDIADPSSPQATVMMIRVGREHVEYLALADCFLLVDQDNGGPQVITDEREVEVRRRCAAALDGLVQDTPEYDGALGQYIEELRARRNQPGGYWIAKDDPRAATEALTGRLPVHELAGAILMSNGASRIVDPYHLARWQDVPELLKSAGPSEIIRRIRRAEASHREASPSAEAADDASIAYCTALDDRERERRQ